jgi:iron-sulfur cluster repair protein YtfE (RIC family)
MKDIAPEMTIKEAMELYPATRAIFMRHRLDTCCGGVHSIVTAALAKGLDPDSLLAELRAAA